MMALLEHRVPKGSESIEKEVWEELLFNHLALLVKTESLRHLFTSPGAELDMLLPIGLDADKTHIRSRHRFVDGFGVIVVILVRFDIGLHILSRNRFHRVPASLKLVCPIVRTGTRFPPRSARW